MTAYQLRGDDEGGGDHRLPFDAARSARQTADLAPARLGSA